MLSHEVAGELRRLYEVVVTLQFRSDVESATKKLRECDDKKEGRCIGIFRGKWNGRRPCPNFILFRARA
jgi:hypothetical protein